MLKNSSPPIRIIIFWVRTAEVRIRRSGATQEGSFILEEDFSLSNDDALGCFDAYKATPAPRDPQGILTPDARGECQLPNVPDLVHIEAGRGENRHIFYSILRDL